MAMTTSISIKVNLDRSLPAPSGVERSRRHASKGSVSVNLNRGIETVLLIFSLPHRNNSGLPTYLDWRRQRFRACRPAATAAGQHDAEYITLNIFCDDHERNLVSWCDMRGGSRTPSGFTRPHLRVNVGDDKFEECENLIQTPEGVYQLCDRQWVSKMFHDEPVLPLGITRRAPECAARHLDSIAQGFGVATDRIAATDPVAAVEEVFETAAFYSTCSTVTTSGTCSRRLRSTPICSVI